MLLGIDLGTSSLKVMLVDPDASVTLVEREPIQVMRPGPGAAEGDPHAWWGALVRILQRMREQHQVEMRSVRGVGISAIYPALVPMDADGNALRHALLYCDLRSAPQAEALAASFGRRRFEARTGNRLTPGTCTLPGVLWLRDHEPRTFAATHIFGQATTFLVHKLTGEFALDASQASLSGMCRSGHELEWDNDILSHVDLDASRLPPLFEPTEVVGQVTERVARTTGLPAGVPVVAGAGDAPLAALGGGVSTAHRLFCCAGTTDCLMFSGTCPPANPVFANCRYALPGLWVSIGTMSCAGAAVKWFCDDIMHCTAEEMTRWAAEAPPGARGLVFLPYLQGERTPWWDPSATGVFFGLTTRVGRAEMCRAVFEGVAFGWRQIVALIEEEYAFRAAQVTLVGGGSTNRLWNEIRASALGRPVDVLGFSETSSLGAALLAGIGVGVFADAEAAANATRALHETERIAPRLEWMARYDDAFAVYDRLYPTVRELYHSRSAGE